MEERVNKLETRVDKIEHSVQDIHLRTTILENSLIRIDRNIDCIFLEIKEIRKLREEDHFVKPLDKSERLKSQIFGVIIGLVVAAFLTFLFPQIG